MLPQELISFDYMSSQSVNHWSSKFDWHGIILCIRIHNRSKYSHMYEYMYRPYLRPTDQSSMYVRYSTASASCLLMQTTSSIAIWKRMAVPEHTAKVIRSNTYDASETTTAAYFIGRHIRVYCNLFKIDWLRSQFWVLIKFLHRQWRQFYTPSCFF